MKLLPEIVGKVTAQASVPRSTPSATLPLLLGLPCVHQLACGEGADYAGISKLRLPSLSL